MKKQTAGFTAPEMLTVIAITGVLASLAVSSFAQSSRDSKVRERVVELMKHLNKTRRIVRTGAKDIGKFKGRVASAGIMFRSTSYDLFVDADDEPGGEILVQTVNVDSNRLVITQAPKEIRFLHDGTIGGNQDIEVRIFDAERKRTHGVSVTYGGQSSLSDTSFTK